MGPEYVYGPGLSDAVDRSGNVQVSHTDGLGSVPALTDANGNVIQTYRSGAFGIPTQTQGTSTQPFQYTGQQRDASTGLYYLRARMYDPTIGRFLSRDPLVGSLWSPVAFNPYLYALSDPLNSADPSGLAASRAASDRGSGDNECLTTLGGKLDFYGVNATCTDWQTNGKPIRLFRTPSGEWIIVPGSFAMSKNPSNKPNNKDIAREIARSMQLPAEQLAAVLRAIQRASSQSIIDVTRQTQDVVVRVTRPGYDFGYQVIETLVRPDGTKNVVQKVYDDAGNLIHIDPKTP